MFQSSRIASGRFFLHDSIASSPFSASTIWNSSPSRMRRATLRMTLESSTTKQVFIASTLHAARGEPALVFCLLRSRCDRLGGQVEDAIDIENDHKLTVEPENAGRDAGELAIEIHRIRLALAVGKLQHLTERIDQKAE